MAIPGSILDNAQTKELKTYLAGQVARAAVIFQVDEIVVFDDQLGNNYLETPQYLRRALFPMHTDLSCAGLLNPLDCPHHLRAQEWSVYREVVVDKRIQPGIRVTVKIDEASKDFKKKMVGKLVSSAEPREQLGVYWGYTTRVASSLSNVWTDCPFAGGYDLKFRHALVVFGGVAGIEECVDADEKVPVSGEDSNTLFDMWVNTCPEQGSRTIRSESSTRVPRSSAASYQA
ncbi:putative RNA methyltransferase [Phytophthora infestans]|uniref:Putative RNA methyltransferase n=1 Tax=Phytophthora infestans TaxID=4787 RepID=A0A833WCC6_PHYIN|nr:putative RNA methyltransferase [Phytophthora infestans]